MMWFRRTVMLAVGMMTIVGIAAAQNAPAPPATARTVVAATKLSTVSDVPLYFSVASVELPAGLTSSVSKANGILYRTPASIPDLRPGGYDLNLTRVTFPAGMPSNAPHHRSGAALYYVLSGTGANTIDGKVISRTPGSFIYEPFDLVHQWGSPEASP
jgi:mannose-6-phosphate isomerase-like protein (cupin superfamily)